MLSTADLERLIAVKRREIDNEKTRLGLASPRTDDKGNEESKTDQVSSERAGEHDAAVETQRETEDVPPDLERYIRRYIGLPGMLKAGEYSPNNPLIRAERAPGDALLGLGEYERRRNTLRKLRQQQYREYLDQQAKKKQEEKERAERERREREQKEREQEEREREREQLERDRVSPEKTRAYTNTVFSTQTISKVDTGVQTNGVGRPLSVAVQTDDAEFYRRSPPLWSRAAAERELSPRPAPRPAHAAPRPAQRRSFGDYEQESLLLKREEGCHYKPSLLDADAIQMRNEKAEKEAAAKRQFYQQELKNQILEQQRIREERKAREKMLEQAEMRRLEEQLRMLRMAQEREIGKQVDIADEMKENATDYEKKRTALQKEIDLEQKALLRVASKPVRPTHTSHSDPPSKLPLYYPPVHGKRNSFTKSGTEPTFSTNIPDNSIFSPNYDVDSYLRKNLNPTKETLLHNRIDTASSAMGLSSKYLNRFITDDRKTGYRLNERKSGYSNSKLDSPDIKAAGDSNNDSIMKISYGSNGDRKITGYVKDNEIKTGFSFNDRKATEFKTNEINTYSPNDRKSNGYSTNDNEKKTGFSLNDAKKLTGYVNDKKIVIEKAIVHDRPKEKKYEPSRRNEIDNPIPVLRHSPGNAKVNEYTDLSDAMQVVDNKWKVPAVQKNILKSLPNEEGKSVSILTQLGSIRRQLQLEQLKLDKMLNKDET